jgi:NhaA family Na+:H+ antiporter
MALGAVATLTAVLIAFNFGGIRKITPYLLIAIILWYALMLSGIHATLAGVIGAFCVPAMPKYKPKGFTQKLNNLMEQFQQSYKKDKDIRKNDELQGIVHSMEYSALNVQTMSQRLEHFWHLPVAYLIIPIFVLVNAGIQLDFPSLGTTFGHPVSMGIFIGLLMGKVVGITGISWIFLKLNLATLPDQVSFNQIAGVSLLAGIGFTMSIFIAELAFQNHAELLLSAKTGIIAASLIAGVAGSAWLFIVSKHRKT